MTRVTDHRLEIPEAVKREVRVRCGFGCVHCGAPAYHYDHIQGIAVTGHEPDAITLLCPNIHNEKSVGRVTVRQVEAWNADPINKRRGQSAPHQLYFDDPNFFVEVGTLRFTLAARGGERIKAISVDGGIVLGFRVSDGGVLFDLNVRDADNR